MINELEAFQIYSSIKLHFGQKSYCFKKYGLNKNKFNKKMFECKNEKYFFHKLAKQYPDKNNLIALLAINFFFDPKLWIDDLMQEKAKEKYLKAKAFNDAQLYYIKEDFKHIINKYGSFTNSMKMGGIITEVLTEEINVGTYCIMNRIYSIEDVIDKHCADNIVWETVSSRLRKYDAFIKVKDIEFYKTVKQELRQIVYDDQNRKPQTAKY